LGYLSFFEVSEFEVTSESARQAKWPKKHARIPLQTQRLQKKKGNQFLFKQSAGLVFDAAWTSAVFVILCKTHARQSIKLSKSITKWFRQMI
jgi:hypothetical protein